MCLCVCIGGVAITVGSDSEDDDNEEDDKECLKTLRQKVCMHMSWNVYICMHICVGTVCLSTPEWQGKLDMVKFIDHTSQKDSQNQPFWQSLTTHI